MVLPIKTFDDINFKISHIYNYNISILVSIVKEVTNVKPFVLEKYLGINITDVQKVLINKVAFTVPAIPALPHGTSSLC
jgi:hypothetical protein